ncbi:MAG TPA: response regulator transcription factor [Paraburkholderia sp.]|uniref:response regulator transcription factor n=1 Tax=Paraburkholderia sp. TaxID=1926495 RepID=UPI002B58E68D|nr:response regulator transcription factor [Paraburkholderia sp.]HTR09402.1 response regulator transcription factor [Paraburkholderia sp.]
MRILVVEDDIDIGQGLLRALKDTGYSVDWIRDGASAKEAMLGNAYSIILLDLGLPGSDGIDVLSWTRSRGCTTPVLIVTARDDIDTRIRGLDIGADDYLLKPFNTSELLARIRAIVRRHAGAAVSTLGDETLCLNLEKRELSFRGHREVLPAREFALVAALLERPGVILSRSQLEDRLYGWGEEVESNAVAVLIHAVRKKFGHEVIRNIRGFGWTIDLPSRDGANPPPAAGDSGCPAAG